MHKDSETTIGAEMQLWDGWPHAKLGKNVDALSGANLREQSRIANLVKAEDFALKQLWNRAPEAAEGKRDLTIQQSILDLLNEDILDPNNKLSSTQINHALTYLHKIFKLAHKELNWDVTPPAPSHTIKRTFNPLHFDNYKQLKEIASEFERYENFMTESQLSALEASQNSGEQHDQFVWGCLFYSMARYSAILDLDAFVLMTQPSTQAIRFNHLVWIDLKDHNPDSASPLIRIHLDEISLILFTQIKKEQCYPIFERGNKNEKEFKQLQIQWVESAIENFRRFMLTGANNKKAKLSSVGNWLHQVEIWFRTALSPILIDLAKGWQLNTAFHPLVFNRIVTRVKTPISMKTEDHQLENWEAQYNFTQSKLHAKSDLDEIYSEITQILRNIDHHNQPEDNLLVELDDDAPSDIKVKTKQSKRIRAAQALRHLQNTLENPPIIIQVVLMWLIDKLKQKAKFAVSSAYQYLSSIGKPLINLLADKDLLGMDEEQFIAIYEQVLEKGKARSTKQDKAQQIYQLHRYMVVHLGVENVDFRFCDGLSGSVGAKAHFLTEYEYMEVLKTLQQNTGHPLSRASSLIFTLCYRCGLRIGEAVHLQLRDLQIPINLNLDEIKSIPNQCAITLKIRPKKFHDLKSNVHSRRQLPLHLLLSKTELQHLLEFYQNRLLFPNVTKDSFLFANPKMPDTNVESYVICNMVVPVLRDVTLDDEMTMHQLRHSFCSLLFALLLLPEPVTPFPNHWINQQHHVYEGCLLVLFTRHKGAPFGRCGAYQIMEWMGHFSPSMSLQAYMHWSHLLIRQHIDKFRVEHKSMANADNAIVLNAGKMKEIVMRLLNISDGLYRQMKNQHHGHVISAVAAFRKVKKLTSRQGYIAKKAANKPQSTVYNKSISEMTLIEWINFFFISAKTGNPRKSESLLYLIPGSAEKVIAAMKLLSTNNQPHTPRLFQTPSKKRMFDETVINFYNTHQIILPTSPKDKEQRIAELTYQQLQRLYKARPEKLMQALSYFVTNYRLDGGYTRIDKSLESEIFAEVISEIKVPEIEVTRLNYFEQVGKKPRIGKLWIKEKKLDQASYGFKYAMVMFSLSLT